MKKHRGRTTDNAVQTKKRKLKGKKSNYKPEKQTWRTLKHFPSLEWKAVTMGITKCQFQPSLICIILAQPFKQTKNHRTCRQEFLWQPKELQSSETPSKAALKHRHMQSTLVSKFRLTLPSYSHAGHSHNDILVLKINWEAYLRSLTATRR